MYSPREGERVQVIKNDPATSWARIGDRGSIISWGGIYHGRLIVDVKFDRDNMSRYSVLVDQLAKERPDTPFERDLRSYIDGELRGPS